MLLRDKFDTLNDIEWKHLHEHVVYNVQGYLQPTILKPVEDYDEVSVLFDALKCQFHHMKLSYRLYTHFKLMIFKMKNSGTKI